jgi:hypothetical protein
MARRRVVYVPVHRAIRIKLRVVKRIKRFETKFERLGLGEFGNFVQRDIELLMPGP